MKKFLTDLEVRGTITIPSINNNTGSFLTRTAGGVLSIRTPAEVLIDIGANFSGSASIILSGTSFQRAALTGDVTAAQNNNNLTISNNAITTAKITNSNVTFAKIQNITTARILGRVTSGTGVVEQLTAAQVKGLLDLSDGIGLDPNSPQEISYLAKAGTRQGLVDAQLDEDTLGFYEYDPAWFIKRNQFTESGIDTVNLLSGINSGRTTFTPTDMLAGKGFKLELAGIITSSISQQGDGVVLRIGIGTEKFSFLINETSITNVKSIFIFYISFYTPNKVRVTLYTNLGTNNNTTELTINHSIPQDISLDYIGKKATDKIDVLNILLKPIHHY